MVLSAIADCEGALFHRLSAMMSFNPIEGGPLAIVSRSGEPFEDAISLARACGTEVAVFPELAPVLSSILLRRSHWSMLMVNLDDQDIDHGVEALSAFRQRVPLQKIVLASRGFRDYDFSEERLAIADASLRVPFGFEGAEKAFLAAEENNAVWNARLRGGENREIMSKDMARDLFVSTDRRSLGGIAS
jgi:hypothetical protein